MSRWQCRPWRVGGRDTAKKVEYGRIEIVVRIACHHVIRARHVNELGMGYVPQEGFCSLLAQHTAAAASDQQGWHFQPGRGRFQARHFQTRGMMVEADEGRVPMPVQSAVLAQPQVAHQS